MDLNRFIQEFESSGMTQSAFGESRGMSKGMVSYYLKKARLLSSASEVENFVPIPSSDSGISQSNMVIELSGELKITINL